MQFQFKRWGSVALIVAMLNSAACGYLIYPERQGSRGDRVDGTVVALDAIGLLFFIFPGVVAFAVDFSTGCIYMPKGKDGAFSLQENPKTEAEEWVPVAQVAPFADDATIAAALQNYLIGSDRNAVTAHIEWRPASVFNSPVFTTPALATPLSVTPAVARAN